MDKMLSVLLFALISTFGCQKKMQDVIEISPTEKAELTAKTILKTDYEVSLNSNEQFALLTKEMKALGNSIHPTLQIVIYDLKGEEILFDQKIPKGNAHWQDEHNIIMWSVPGRLAPDHKVEKRLFNVIERGTTKIRQ